MVEFRVWAPNASSVALRLRGEEHALRDAGDGMWEAEARAQAGDRYVYVLDGGEELADPCSRFQPDGVRGSSEVVGTAAFAWTDDGWDRLALDELVVYELHVGTFTPKGTFDAVIEHLPALRELGVTAIELMPVADFPGDRGWGYDGLYLYAPHRAYGGPHGLARLVDAAHATGLGVILDVVYNHLGPGNERIAAFGPYFTDRHETFWGDALDYSQGPVREWAIQSGELWVRDYHVDGLRLDATHAVFDDGPTHVLAELADRVRAAREGALVISEMGPPDFRPLREWGHDAMWMDNLHHALHVALTRERDGYYRPFDGTLGAIARELERPERARIIACAQNHDQVGNRAVGDRLPRAELRVAAAVVLFSPFTPLLFMGEEYGEPRPFQFFTDHVDPAIADATREGRRREFAGFAGFSRDDVPDPQARETFERSKLSRDGDAELRALYRELLRLRRELPPALETSVDEEARVLRVRRGPAELVADFERLTVDVRT